MIWRFWLTCALAWTSAEAVAVPLQTIGTFCTLFPDQCRKGTESLLAARGIGTNAYYVLEVDPTTGEIPVSATFSGSIVLEIDAEGVPGDPAPNSALEVAGVDASGTLRSLRTETNGTVVTTQRGRAYADSFRNVYSSTAVTTGAWVQMIASTAAVINWLYMFDSCGQTLELGSGALASETRIMIIPPGGVYGVPLSIAAGTRLSLRAISANCSIGESDFTGLN